MRAHSDTWKENKEKGVKVKIVTHRQEVIEVTGVTEATGVTDPPKVKKNAKRRKRKKKNGQRKEDIIPRALPKLSRQV